MNRNLFFIAIALLLWGFGEGLFFNFQPIYLKSLGSDEKQIGFILGAFGAAMAITHIPAGRLADRIGRRPLLVAAWIMGLLSTIVMALARELSWFVAGMLGYGLTAFVASPLSSYVTAARGNWSISMALSLTTATFNAGMVLGPVTGGWIAEHFGLRMIYFVAAGFFLASTFCILFIQKQPIDHHDPEMPPPALFNNIRLMRYIGIVAFAVFAMYLAQPLTPNFLEDVRGLSLSSIGLVFTMGALGNALLAIFLSRATPYYGFLIAQGMVGMFALLIWQGASLPSLALGYFLLGGFRAARPLALAQARELVHDSQMGFTYGLMETVSAVIFILTPPFAGFLYAMNPMAIYPLALGLIIVSVIMSSLLLRRLVHA
ncbi:MAG TPA: MFS transporter [Anaerolineales bacterium]|nr:MFS transporter [Anaerolineales bacterium]